MPRSSSSAHTVRKPYERCHPSKEVLKSIKSAPSDGIDSSSSYSGNETSHYSGSPSSSPTMDPSDIPLPIFTESMPAPLDGLSHTIASQSSLFSVSDEDGGTSLDPASDATPSTPSNLDQTIDTDDPGVKEEEDSEAAFSLRDPESPRGQSLSDIESDATMSDGDDSTDEPEDIAELRNAYASSKTIPERSDTLLSQESVSMHSLSDSESDLDEVEVEHALIDDFIESPLNDSARAQDRCSPHPAQHLSSQTQTTLPHFQTDSSSARTVVLTVQVHVCCSAAPLGSSGSLIASCTSGPVASDSHTIVIPPGAHLELSVTCEFSDSSGSQPSELRVASGWWKGLLPRSGTLKPPRTPNATAKPSIYHTSLPIRRPGPYPNLSPLYTRAFRVKAKTWTWCSRLSPRLRTSRNTLQLLCWPPAPRKSR
ncbi:hypothetical protein C8T65DRAFT_730707 [Cerioporus squamosus]|nr:hypothetical protein C8T65DRAFT_730707 [Cerioporus squamosus]